MRTYTNIELDKDSSWTVKKIGNDVNVHVNQGASYIGIFCSIEELEAVEVSDLKGCDATMLSFEYQSIIAPTEMAYKIVGKWMDLQAQDQGVGVA